MSVIALKSQGVTYLACDSLIKEYSFKYISRSEENYSIFPLKGMNGVLVGHDGSDRECDLLKTTNIVPSEYKDVPLSYEVVVRIIVPRLFEELEKAKYLSKDAYGENRYMHSQWILATKEKIFIINPDGAVTAFNDFASIGTGSTILMGSLSSHLEKAPKERKNGYICQELIQ